MGKLPFDQETGEIYDLEVVREHQRKVEEAVSKPFLQSINLDVMKEGADLLKYNEAMYGHIYYPMGVINIESMVVDWSLTNAEMAILSYVSQRVNHHNYAIVHTQSIIERMGWKKSMYYKTMSALKARELLVFISGKLVKIHPYFQWRGNSTKRWESMCSWYEINNKNDTFHVGEL